MQAAGLPGLEDLRDAFDLFDLDKRLGIIIERFLVPCLVLFLGNVCLFCMFFPTLVWGSSFLCLIRLLPPASRRIPPHRDNNTHTETTHTEIILPPHRDNTYRDHTPRHHTQRQHTPRRHRQRSHTQRSHKPEFVADAALCEPPRAEFVARGTL